MINLAQFHDSHNNKTQFGQAGVLQKIFETIGTTNKYFVEFGSEGTSTGQGNSYSLRHLGFDGLLMDAGVYNNEFPVQSHFITAENINELFEKYNVPNIFDFLSIDMDGNDFYIWQILNAKYRPRVLSIESNPHYPSNCDAVPPCQPQYRWQGEYSVGCSALAIYNLCQTKDYFLVAHCGVDSIYLSKEVVTEFSDWTNLNNFSAICTHTLYDPRNPPSNYLTSKDII